MHRSLCHAALAACLVFAATPAATADELKLFDEAHTLNGQEDGVAFQGQVRFHTDATFTGERVYADGRREAISGRVQVVKRDFVLVDASGGAVGVISGASATTSTYSRQGGDTYRWRYDDPADADHATLTLPCKEHTSAVAAKLLFRIGSWNWLLNNNLGKVDRRQGAEIYRSREPKPKHVLKYQQRYGIKTVLSLNGEQDDAVEVEINGQQTTLTMHDFMLRRGLANPHVSMGSTLAPTDDQLVAVFRVLLDDSAKPILLHCTGGADRTGIIAALYQVEFMGRTKQQARKAMRHHMWTAHDGTEIQGAYLDLYQPGHIRHLLQAAGVQIPARYRQP